MLLIFWISPQLALASQGIATACVSISKDGRIRAKLNNFLLSVKCLKTLIISLLSRRLMGFLTSKRRLFFSAILVITKDLRIYSLLSNLQVKLSNVISPSHLVPILPPNRDPSLLEEPKCPFPSPTLPSIFSSKQAPPKPAPQPKSKDPRPRWQPRD